VSSGTEVLALELEAVRPDECVTGDEACQCGLGFTGDAVGVCLAVYSDPCRGYLSGGVTRALL